MGLVADLPPEKPGEIKQDWNDVLKASKFDNQEIQEEEKTLPATETNQGLHNQIEDTKKAPEHSQEQIKRGPMSVRGLYSLKLKAVPHPKSPKQPPLNALLPDVLPYPLAI